MAIMPRKDKKMGICIQCYKERVKSYDTYFCSKECKEKWEINYELETCEDEKIKCPYCGSINDMDVVEYYGNSDNEEVECSECGKKYLVTSEIKYVFTAKPTNDEIEKIISKREIEGKE
jgi:uncharacterized Zn-finger protein